ncbi:MAG TPA: histidine--tRNA ligase [Nitrolancea sp.]|nr:histidine--tRNA ligase [Nitrolancea sp.]
MAPKVQIPQVLKGMRDFLPEQMLLREQIIGTLRAVFQRYGFEPIETPVVEYLETLTGKYGEDEKLIYQFKDRGDRSVGLRYDLTVPLARYIANHRSKLTFPFKRYHIAPVFRADRPQAGRYREFWQGDVDIIGTRSMIADAELIAVWAEVLTALNVPNFVVQISHRRLLQSLAEFAGVPSEQAATVYRAIDKLAKIGREGVREEMIRAGIPAASAEKILDLVELQGSPQEVLPELRARLAGSAMAEAALADLESLFQYLATLPIGSHQYALDPALARGLDYYTGPVFEVTVKEPNIGSLGGGGRYDHLIGMFLGEEIPATGASLGLERLHDVIAELKLLETPRTVSRVLVTIFSEELTVESLGLVTCLRQAGISAEVYLGGKYKLGDQLQYAGKKGIPLAAIAGPDEVQAGTVTLRHMATRKTITVPQTEIALAVANLLSQPQEAG